MLARYEIVVKDNLVSSKAVTIASCYAALAIQRYYLYCQVVCQVVCQVEVFWYEIVLHIESAGA